MSVNQILSKLSYNELKHVVNGLIETVETTVDSR